MGCLLSRMRAAAARSMSAPPGERPAAGAGRGDAPPPPPALSPPPRPASPPGARLFADYCDLPAMLGHPDLGRVVLGWLGDDTRSATALRGTCRDARDAVAAHAWHDTRARIRWPARWRAAFPAATAAHVSREWYGPLSALTDADFVRLRGVHELDMSGCNQETITDAAFAHLAGIHTLCAFSCPQLTAAAFAHLARRRGAPVGSVV